MKRKASAVWRGGLVKESDQPLSFLRFGGRRVVLAKSVGSRQVLFEHECWPWLGVRKGGDVKCFLLGQMRVAPRHGDFEPRTQLIVTGKSCSVIE